MNLTRLRSKLAFSCPDLQTLTLKDLEECPWSTKQRIVLALYQDSSLLQDNFESLQELIESKSSTLAKWKKSAPNSVSKEEKKKYEHNFRLDFLQIFLSGLEVLKWPPALEAFSDPIPSLQSDPSSFHSAIDFLVTVLYPQSKQINNTQADLSGFRPNSVKTPFSPRDSSANDNNADPPTPLLETYKVDIISSSNLDHSTISMQHQSSFVSDMVPNTPQSGVMSRNNIGASSRGAGAADARNVHLTNESKIIHMLQVQNEELTRQLHNMQKAIEKRQEAEVKIGHLIRDFRTSLSDIASIGSDAPAKPTASDLGTVLPMTVRRLYEQVRGIEEQWVEASKRAKGLTSTVTHNDNKYANSHIDTGGSKVFRSEYSHSFGSSNHSNHIAGGESGLLHADYVHTLTRELVVFSDVASSVVDKQDSLELSSRLVEYLSDIEQLQSSAQSLAMKLSRLSPLLDCASNNSKEEELWNKQCNSIDKLSLLLSEQLNKNNQHFVQPAQRYLEEIVKEQQHLLRTISQQKRFLKQLVHHSKAQQSTNQEQYEKLSSSIIPPCEELSTMCIALKEVCETAARAKKAKVRELSGLNISTDSMSRQSTPRLKTTQSEASMSSSAGGVIPWDLLAQGRAGQEVAYMFLTLNTYLPTLMGLTKELESLPHDMQRSLREVFHKPSAHSNNIKLTSFEGIYTNANTSKRAVKVNDKMKSPKKSPKKEEGSINSPSGSGSKRQAGSIKRSISAGGSQKQVDSRPPFDLSLS